MKLSDPGSGYKKERVLNFLLFCYGISNLFLDFQEAQV